MASEVRKNEAQSRYEIVVDGKVLGTADYRVDGDRIVMSHTVIDRSYRGTGLGSVLVRGALDDIRATGRHVVPVCWYVAQFIDENPSYADLAA